MKFRRLLLLLLAVAGLFFSCKEAKKGKAMLPAPAGAICDVMIVISEESWNGELGKAFKEALTDQYPYLPQVEPYFRVSHVTKDVFTATAERFRNLIIVKVDPKFTQTQLVIQRDVHASAQVVINLAAPDASSAAIYIKENAERLREILDQTEKDRFAAIAKSKAEMDITNAVKEKFGFELYFPSGYQLRTSKPDFMWVSLETNLSSQGLLVYTSKYEGEVGFSAERLIKVADGFTKSYVPGPSDGSYMVTSKVVPPKVEKLTYKGRTWYRMRGLWEVENDFMGGPFISYSTYWKEKNEVLHVRAYLYSPKKDKRKTLLQTEALIFNLSLDGK